MILAFFEEGKVIEIIDKIQVISDRHPEDFCITRCLVKGLVVLKMA